MDQLPLMENIHGPNHFVKHALAPAAVSGFRKALQGNGRHEVCEPQHIIGKCFVDQGTVGEAEEHAVIVLFAQLDDVGFAHQRLAACVYVHIYTHIFALADDVVDLIKAKIQLVAIFRRPAAGAVQIAGRGGVQQDRPGDVAVVFFFQFLLLGPADHVLIDKKIDSYGFQHFLIHIANQVADVAVIGIFRILNGVLHLLQLMGIHFPSVFFRPGKQLAHIFLWVFVQVIERLLQAEFFHHR